MNSKGVTPVVATVLLMTITVAATASAFTFMNGIQQDFRDNTEDNLNDRQKRSQSDINIETAYNSTDGYILLSVRNTGSLTLEVEDDDGNKLWNLFIDGRPVDDGTGWKHRDSVKKSVAPQSTVGINTTKKFPKDDSDTLIKITGPNGVSDSKVCYNSGSPSC
jgi:flagellin-like protein